MSVVQCRQQNGLSIVQCDHEQSGLVEQTIVVVTAVVQPVAVPVAAASVVVAVAVVVVGVEVVAVEEDSNNNKNISNKYSARLCFYKSYI